MYYPKNAYAIIGTYMDPLYVNYDKRKNATSNSAVPTPTANTMPVFGAPAANTSAPTALVSAAPAAPVASAPAAPAPAPIAPAAPTVTPSLEPAPAASPANTLVAELDAPVVEQNPFASFQNNTPAAEPQPVQQFAPAEQPLQTQPIGPAPISSGTGDIVLDMSQPKGGINKKLLAIIGGVVLVVVVAVVAVFFLIPKDRATREDAEELSALLSVAASNTQCPNAVRDLNSTFYSDEKFVEETNECREKAKRMESLIKKLGSVSDSGFKDVFAKLKTEIEKNLLFGAELDSELDILESWHRWVLSNQTTGETQQTEQIVRSIASPLLNSGNEMLKKYGDEWINKKIAVIDAETAYELMPDNSNLAAELNEARANMDDYIAEEAPSGESFSRIISFTPTLELKESMAAYNKYMRNNYEKTF